MDPFPLTAFALATNDKLPVPIKLITFASPQPGHVDLVHVIEKLGIFKRLYHLRVMNNDDIAPQLCLILNSPILNCIL